MPRSYPYRCPECLTEDPACYNGMLVFEDQAIPFCLHHDELGPVLMVPVREVRPDVKQEQDLHVGTRAA